MHALKYNSRVCTHNCLSESVILLDYYYYCRGYVNTRLCKQHFKAKVNKVFILGLHFNEALVEDTFEND